VLEALSVCRPEQRMPADVFHHMDMVEMQVPGDVSHVARCFFLWFV
jgi:hypothetical protein